MSSKFFNNDTGHTLFDKLKGIASGMANRRNTATNRTYKRAHMRE